MLYNMFIVIVMIFVFISILFNSYNDNILFIMYLYIHKIHFKLAHFTSYIRPIMELLTSDNLVYTICRHFVFN